MIKQEIKAHLENVILPFWQGLRDTEYGGFCGFVGEDLRKDPHADKGCILNSRILWTFSSAAILSGREDLKECARHAYDFLQCFLDREHGGVYWSVTFDGKPSDTTKHTYCQAFTIYGLAAYYRLTGSSEALALAADLFRIIEGKCRDEGGYLEALKADFSPESNEKLSENGVMASRTMNTLLHVIEAYAELYRAKPDEAVRAAGDAGLYQCLNTIYNPEKRRMEVFFDADFRPILDMQSYGHDIEGSWLIWDAAETLLDPAAQDPFRAMCMDLLESPTERAFTDHGLDYETVNGVVNTNRAWWPQAEAVLGFEFGWRMTKNPEWLRRIRIQWDYILRVFADRRDGGEWLNELLEDGTSIHKPVVEEWKCPYHNGRMCLRMIQADLPADL